MMTKLFPLLLVLLFPLNLFATDIWVTELIDDLDESNGTCNLREAIKASNSNQAVDECPEGSSADRIFFEKTGVINLLEELPSIFRDLEIIGPGRDLLIIDGGFHDTVLKYIAGGRTFELSGLTIRGGSGISGGGVNVAGTIQDQGTLLIRDCDITDNFSNTGGAGIRSSRVDLTLKRVNVIDNTVTGGGSTNGYGGGIDFESGSLTIEDSSISRNVATNQGGGVFFRSSGDLNITRTTISGNESVLLAGLQIIAEGTQQELSFTNNTIVFNIETTSQFGSQAAGLGIQCIPTASVDLLVQNNIAAHNSNLGLGIQKDLSLDVNASDCVSTLGTKYNLVGTVALIHLATWPEGNPNANGDFVGSSSDPNTVDVGSLSMNGRSTSHHALLSTATNIIDQGLCVGEAHDQIGHTGDQDGPERGLDIAGIPNNVSACDIGAIEFRAFPLRVDFQPIVFLDGPFLGGGMAQGSFMSTDLADADLIPSQQPFNAAPWNHSGGEFINPIPDDMVDWVLIRIWEGGRMDTDGLVEVDSRAYGLDRNGAVFNSTGSGYFNFVPGNYYVTIEHRNHLGIMSAEPFLFSWDTSSFLDFRMESNFYTQGGQAYRDRDGIPTMWAGDGNVSGDITAFDFLDVWLPENGSSPGYKLADFNLDGVVTAFDFLNGWLPANGQDSQIPD